MEELKQLITSETKIPVTSQHFYFNGGLLQDKKTLKEFNIGEGDMVAMHVRHIVGQTGVPPASPETRASGPSSNGGPSTGSNAYSRTDHEPSREDADPETIRMQVLGHPASLAMVRDRNPALAAAAEAGPEAFRRTLFEMRRIESNEQRSRQQEIARLNEDVTPETQAKIAELIRQEAVNENLQNALEHHPECKR